MHELKQHLLNSSLEQLKHETEFSKSEIEGLCDQFWHMAYKPGVMYSMDLPPRLSYDDLIRFTDYRNPIQERIVLAFMGIAKGTDVIHQIQRGRLDFVSFVKRMAIFTPHASSQDKLAYIFRIYDPSNNESIGVGDVKALLVDLHGDSMTEDQRETLAINFMSEFGSNAADEVKKETFLMGCEGTALEDMMARFS